MGFEKDEKGKKNKNITRSESGFFPQKHTIKIINKSVSFKILDDKSLKHQEESLTNNFLEECYKDEQSWNLLKQVEISMRRGIYFTPQYCEFYDFYIKFIRNEITFDVLYDTFIPENNPKHVDFGKKNEQDLKNFKEKLNEGEKTVDEIFEPVLNIVRAKVKECEPYYAAYKRLREKLSDVLLILKESEDYCHKHTKIKIKEQITKNIQIIEIPQSQYLHWAESPQKTLSKIIEDLKNIPTKQIKYKNYLLEKIKALEEILDNMSTKENITKSTSSNYGI